MCDHGTEKFRENIKCRPPLICFNAAAKWMTHPALDNTQSAAAAAAAADRLETNVVKRDNAQSDQRHDVIKINGTITKPVIRLSQVLGY